MMPEGGQSPPSGPPRGSAGKGPHSNAAAQSSDAPAYSVRPSRLHGSGSSAIPDPDGSGRLDIPWRFAMEWGGERQGSGGCTRWGTGGPIF
jgi:hypothetical protein